MELGTYELFTKSTARYPKEQSNPTIVEAMYCALGLVGEAGEVSEKIKKWHRDGTVDGRQVALELGDVVWYITRLANTMNYTLEDILRMNVEKLQARRERNTLQGSGDNR